MNQFHYPKTSLWIISPPLFSIANFYNYLSYVFIIVSYIHLVNIKVVNIHLKGRVFMEPNDIDIGKRLQQARKNANLTQQKLADMIKLSVSYVKSTERGNKASLKYLFAVVENCHVSFDWLLTGVQDPAKSPQTIIKDAEIEQLLDVPRKLLNDPNPELQIWAKIQLQKAFADYYPTEK